MSGTNTTTSQIETGIAGATGVAIGVQQAVASQTSILSKIEAGLGEFLQLAPTVAGAIDPAIAGASTAAATLLMTLLNAVQQYHSATVVPAVQASGKS